MSTKSKAPARQGDDTKVIRRAGGLADFPVPTALAVSPTSMETAERFAESLTNLTSIRTTLAKLPISSPEEASREDATDADREGHANLTGILDGVRLLRARRERADAKSTLAVGVGAYLLTRQAHMNQRDYADAVGVSPGRVSQLVKLGRIVTDIGVPAGYVPALVAVCGGNSSSNGFAALSKLLAESKPESMTDAEWLNFRLVAVAKVLDASAAQDASAKANKIAEREAGAKAIEAAKADGTDPTKAAPVESAKGPETSAQDGTVTLRDFSVRAVAVLADMSKPSNAEALIALGRADAVRAACVAMLAALDTAAASVAAGALAVPVASVKPGPRKA